MWKAIILGGLLSLLWVLPAGGKESPTQHPARLKRVHVVVALCDNKNQGIAPVPPALGDGQDPAGNLYWGAAYGVKTFFSKSRFWKRMDGVPLPDAPGILERIGFEGEGIQVVMDAYDGARMRDALDAFFRRSVAEKEDLVCFVGHNGLMELQIDFPDGKPNGLGAMVLACKSRDYFAKPVRKAGRRILLATSGLMAPEGYVLDAALRAWAAGGNARAAAAEAYAKYQNCGRTAADRLFVAPD